MEYGAHRLKHELPTQAMYLQTMLGKGFHDDS